MSDETGSGLHENIVCKVCWAHPEFGQVVASASKDGTCCVWTESRTRDVDKVDGPSTAFEWRLASSFKAGKTEILDMKFAPPQYGLRIALCFRDGSVRFYNAGDIFNLSGWQLVQDFQLGPDETCNKICWRPYSQNMPETVLLGGSRRASVWSLDGARGRWQEIASLPPASSQSEVASVHWANSCGRTSELVAYASQTDVYIVELHSNMDDLEVNVVAHCKHTSPVLQLEWNKLGTTLATSSAGEGVKLWRPDLLGQWHAMASIGASDS